MWTNLFQGTLQCQPHLGILLAAVDQGRGLSFIWSGFIETESEMGIPKSRCYHFDANPNFSCTCWCLLI